MTSNLTLSVIVVNWQVRDLLRDCLRSLFEHMLLPPTTWELIVVDNNSSDDSVGMVREEFPGAEVIANSQNEGFGKANNQAFRISRGKYVLLLNPDTVILNNAINFMLQLIESRPDVGALGCGLLNSEGLFSPWAGGSLPTLGNVASHFLLLNKILPHSLLPRSLYLQKDPSTDLEVGWVSGACMLLRKEALKEEIFDERFFLYGEDIDLCDRLTRSGWKVLYTPRARIVHLEGQSLQSQSPEIQMSKVRAMRELFSHRHNRVALFCYDLIVTFGFFLRTALFALAAVTRPGRGYEFRSAKSRQYSGEALRALFGR